MEFKKTDFNAFRADVSEALKSRIYELLEDNLCIY
jgi:hypothetical protein